MKLWEVTFSFEGDGLQFSHVIVKAETKDEAEAFVIGAYAPRFLTNYKTLNGKPAVFGEIMHTTPFMYWDAVTGHVEGVL